MCEAAELPRITTHGLRRTFNDLDRRVTDKLVLQSITGHVATAITAHYSRVDADEKRAVQAEVLRLCGDPGGDENGD